MRVDSLQGKVISKFPTRFNVMSLVRLERSQRTDVILLFDRSKEVSLVRVASLHGNLGNSLRARFREFRLVRLEISCRTAVISLYERS